MKRLSKVVLLAAGFGLLAVVLSLISKRAVSADDHTNLWDHVVLDCSNPSDGIHCTSWTRVFPNGHSSAFSALPDGKKLVITDLEFNDLSRDGTPGYLAGCSINTTVADGDNVLLQAQGVADLGSDLFGQTQCCPN